MSDRTKIEWTASADGTPGATWNPIVGCSIVSPGCTHCYAMQMAARIEAMAAAETGNPPRPQKPSHYAGTTQPSKAGPVWTGKLALAPDHILTQPLRWKKPRTIFVNSMGDLFHEDAPDHWIDKVFAVMALASQHTFLVLTKRAARMRDYIQDVALGGERIESIVYRAGHTMEDGDAAADFVKAQGWPLPNVWLGVSTERQVEADERIPLLLATPAAKRFISAEPLLGPIELNRNIGGTLWIGGQRGHVGTHHGIGTPECPRERHHHHDDRCEPGLDWVITGGESGKDARPMHPDWIRSLRDQCAAAGVPFFFKQHGEWIAIRDVPESADLYHPAPESHPDARRRCKVETTIMKSDGSTCGPANPGAFLQGSGSHQIFRVGKRAAGRLLDGVEHSERPQP